VDLQGKEDIQGKQNVQGNQAALVPYWTFFGRRTLSTISVGFLRVSEEESGDGGFRFSLLLLVVLIFCLSYQSWVPRTFRPSLQRPTPSSPDGGPDGTD